MDQAIDGLIYGFGVALEPYNLMWSVFGVVAGNLVGVLPGLGSLTAIAILLPLTYTMHPVAAIMMLAGIFYGSMYGGAIGAILLNLPVHPAHAVTCLDGYPLAQKGRGGAALGVAMLASFFAASVGIIVMILFSPVLVNMAFIFGPAELCAVMLLGLIAGSTMSHGSAMKGVAMTLLGLVVGVAGIDPTTGIARFTFGMVNLQDGVDLVALAMGVFGVSEFLRNINHLQVVSKSVSMSMRDMLPTLEELKASFWPLLRGTAVGTLFGALPGTGPTITSFVAYAAEHKLGKHPERLGTGQIGGVAAPEAASHSKTQVDFIPTLSLGIPGDPVMAMILGALLIQGIQPGPEMIKGHPDIFWGLIASFWLGNFFLMILNVPLIGLWVKLLKVPYKFLVPSALFLIAIGCFSTQNDLFEVGEVLVFGVIGAILMYFEFSMASVILGYVLGPLFEQNFRRALLISHGELSVFITHPVSAGFIIASTLLVILEIGASIWKRRRTIRQRT